MKLLICAGDVLQAGEVRDMLRKLLEERFLGFGCREIFVTETRTGSKEEMMIYIFPDPDHRPEEVPHRLKRIGKVLAEQLQLGESQVICPIIFR